MIGSPSAIMQYASFALFIVGIAGLLFSAASRKSRSITVPVGLLFIGASIGAAGVAVGPTARPLLSILLSLVALVIIIPVLFRALSAAFNKPK